MTNNIEHIIGMPIESPIYGKIQNADNCALCGGLPIGQLKKQRFRLVCGNCMHTVHYRGKHGVSLTLHIAYWNGRQECLRRSINTKEYNYDTQKEEND